MPLDQLVEILSLKRKICQAAANALTAANATYVRTFRERLQETGGDLERVIAETKPLLTGHELRDWNDLLTAFLDLQVVLKKVKLSLGLLRSDIAGTVEETGARIVYHVDHWTFQMDALLERLDKLVALVFRRLVRPASSDWRATHNTMRAKVKEMKHKVADTRDPLAHGLGGGVTAIQEGQLWEPFLAAGDFDAELITFRSGERYRQRWHAALEYITAQVLTEMEVIARELSQYIR